MLRKASTTLLGTLLLATLAVPVRAQTGLPPVEPGVPPGFTPLTGARADSVRGVLLGYIDAVKRHDGAAATQAVTRATRAYYAQMRDMAMTAPEAQVRALPLMDRLSVLMYRHRVPADVLRTLTGDAAFAHTISAGWVARTIDGELSPTAEVLGNGDRAIVRDGPLNVQMVREEGAWRWDMMPILRGANAQLAEGKPSRMTEDEFLFFILQTTNERAPTPAIWQPVQ